MHVPFTVLLPFILATIAYAIYYHRKMAQKQRALEAKLREKEAELKWLRNPDPEVVLAQRQIKAEGGFRRRVVGWTPQSLGHNRAELSCGHTIRRSTVDRGREELDCFHCAREFVKQARPR